MAFVHTPKNMLDTATNASTSSPLSSPTSSLTTSPHTTPSKDANAASRNISKVGGGSQGPSTTLNPSTPYSQNFDCFTALANAKVHYYSARELHARGVWVGYLEPKRRKESYDGLPSYTEIMANYRNMVLPYPPPEFGLAARNTMAVCRHCLSKQPKRVLLRQLKYVAGRYVTIMPLDGEDELGMFCIMIPQDLDRSTKSLHHSRGRSTSSLQAWRPYEIDYTDDSKTFKNNLMLLSIRSTKQVTGTLEIIRTILGLQDSSHNGTRTTNPDLLTGTPVHDLMPTIENEDSSGRLHLSRDEPTSRRRKRATASMITPGNDQHKRKRTTVESSEVQMLREPSVSRAGTTPSLLGLDREQPRPALSLDESSPRTFPGALPNILTQQPRNQYLSISNPVRIAETIPRIPEPCSCSTTTPTRTTETAPNLPQLQCFRISNPVGTVATAPTYAKVQRLSIRNPVQTVEIKPFPNLLCKKTREIVINWSALGNGDERKLSISVANYQSCEDLLSKVQETTRSMPSAATLLEKTTAWRMIYSTSSGTSKPQVAHGGIEEAFNIMLDDLAQPSVWALESIRVELNVID